MAVENDDASRSDALVLYSSIYFNTSGATEASVSAGVKIATESGGTFSSYTPDFQANGNSSLTGGDFTNGMPLILEFQDIDLGNDLKMLLDIDADGIGANDANGLADEHYWYWDGGDAQWTVTDNPVRAYLEDPEFGAAPNGNETIEIAVDDPNSTVADISFFAVDNDGSLPDFELNSVTVTSGTQSWSDFSVAVNGTDGIIGDIDVRHDAGYDSLKIVLEDHVFSSFASDVISFADIQAKDSSQVISSGAIELVIDASTPGSEVLKITAPGVSDINDLALKIIDKDDPFYPANDEDWLISKINDGEFELSFDASIYTDASDHITQGYENLEVLMASGASISLSPAEISLGDIVQYDTL